MTLDNVPQRLRELIYYTPQTAAALKEIVHDIECLNIRYAFTGCGSEMTRRLMADL